MTSQEKLQTLELDEKESEIVAVLVRRFARCEREDVMGVILRNIPSGILDDKGVVALANKIESLPIRERLRDPDDVLGPITIDVLLDLLGLVMARDEMPSVKMLEGLTLKQLAEVERWCVAVHWSASDNPPDVHWGASRNPDEAGPMPAYLREHLPDGHPYKTWRVPT
jgi:hypothetical protein